MGYEILTGDAVTMLRTMAAGSVHCVVTSPPYYGLRQYLFDNAVVLRYNLSKEDKEYVQEELRKLGIEPRA